MIRSITFSFLLSIALFFQAQGQNLTFTTPILSGNPGDTLSVDITVTDFTQITSTAGSINWDSTVIRYVSNTVNPALTGVNNNFTVGAPGQGNVPEGRLSWSYFFQLGFQSGVSLPDNDIFITVEFVLLGSAGSSSPLNMDGTTPEPSFSRFDPQNSFNPADEVPANINGSLTMTNRVPSLQGVDADITSNTTWITGDTIILDGYIFVKNNATLTIQPGVLVLGLDDDSTNNILPNGVDLGAVSNPEENVGALIITREGKINAQGTGIQPIIFTAVKDDINDPNDLDCEDTGLWGGLIVLGNATVSSPSANFNGSFVENTVEGIITLNPSTAVDARFGGQNDSSDSGILRYISIRHGGDVLTDGDEINGLTLAGVGRGTTVEFIEVLANADDGVEFFGGTVDTKNLLVACVVDDSYDYDQGFRGRGQYWVTVGLGNRLGEHDGGDNPDSATPESTPVIFNATYVGKTAAFSTGENQILEFRDNAGGNYRNSIFFQSAEGNRIEFRYDIVNSFENFSAVTNDPVLGSIQSLNINNNVFSNISGPNFLLNENSDGFVGATNQIRAIANANAPIPQLANNTAPGNDNQTIPNIFNTSTLPNPSNGAASYDLRPSTAAPSNLLDVSTLPSGNNTDGFFENPGYTGAVNPNAATGAGWMEGWTAANEYQIIK